MFEFLDSLQDFLFQWFSQYPYEPLMVYGAIFGVMLLCALGFPMPEEVVIISAGILGHMSLNPTEYPPPFPGARSVNPIELATACFAAVLLTDFLVFHLGKYFGKSLINSPKLHRYFSKNKIDKIKSWADKRGFWAPAIFRFIPGIRFPGHLMCGALEINTWTFMITNGLAALISVPTQVLLVSYYGETVLEQLKKFKLIAFCTLAVLAIIYYGRKYFKKQPTKA